MTTSWQGERLAVALFTHRVAAWDGSVGRGAGRARDRQLIVAMGSARARRRLRRLGSVGRRLS